MRYVWTILLVAAFSGCQMVTITGAGNTVVQTTNGSLTVPLGGLLP